MPALNWDTFTALPGAADTNFEMLCRALVRRHYGSLGDFRALANQPGVEFHLKLNANCALGDPPRWYGWQCRWYDLPSGRAIRTTRRRKIEEAIAKTEEILPGLTDWVLWTRHPLTQGDQDWFFTLKTRMQLHLWTGADVEVHLSGPAEIYRSTYFGELVLTPNSLADLHAAAVAPVKNRWHPAVHQIVDCERTLRRALGESAAWSDLPDLAGRIQSVVEAVNAGIPDLPSLLGETTAALIRAASILRESLMQSETALQRGDYEFLRQEPAGGLRPAKEWTALLRQLRAGRYSASLVATNLLADMYGSQEALNNLNRALTERLVAIIADAGCGKTQLAAELTARTDDRPAGIFLHGRDLNAGQGLDDLARRVVVNGAPVRTFEALVAAVDAAGQRAGRRLPIVLDGLNEAEDPRDWKAAIASLRVILQRYSYVLVVCTLRSAFVPEALPDDVDRLEMPGFEHDTPVAVRRYFQHYRIDLADAYLPMRLLAHALTLYILCEVTNPTRERTVGIEAMPGSLTALFDRYLEQVAERVGQLAPRSWRYYASDIRTALNRIGLTLWEAKARSIDISELRGLLDDHGRPWDRSIVRALEDDGVLIRVPGDGPSAGHMAIVYDALAGHLVADALLDKFGGHDFADWMQTGETLSGFAGEINERHPLATDIFRGLVGLAPRRMYRRQLWPLLEEPLRIEALYESALLEAPYLDGETVTALASLVERAPIGHRDIFDQLWTTRGARSHPLNSEFLDSSLRSVSMPDRDLRWTEWVRRNQAELLEDLRRLEERWRAVRPGEAGHKLRARWAMWTLTSTVRVLRDQATRALYRLGCSDPNALFDLALESLTVNDPYVSERMLAACYGVAMSLWADPRGDAVRDALPEFASALVDLMFVPRAPHPTYHVLMRDSALGLITLARRVSPGCIAEATLRYLVPPFDHLPSPFPEPAAIEEDEVAEAEAAIHMDFENYTIGRLIRDRSNYDFENPEYQQVRRQIDARIVQLGYSSARFADVDRAIAHEAGWAARRGAPKVDRYGKKYSWVAFFEMYGLRLDQGKLAEWGAGERTSDVDVDPSFPEPPPTWVPSLTDPFADAPTEARTWITNGPTPDYDHLLNPEEVDGQRGPWALLEGYVEQSAASDDRRVFTFLRGIFVEVDRVAELCAAFDSVDYPGNRAIPEPYEDYYTYAGEIPWSTCFGAGLRDATGSPGRNRQDAFDYHDGTRWRSGIPVEVPVHRFAWEGYHSELNQVSGIVIPAPALCEQLRLSNRQAEWDLYDSASSVASLYREFKSDNDLFASHFSYIRCDLLPAIWRRRVRPWYGLCGESESCTTGD